MTATLTRTKTGKTRRVPMQAKNPPIEDEVAGDDETDSGINTSRQEARRPTEQRPRNKTGTSEALK
ncbi:hypothetical protein PR001_g9826 [Phytophthora rubi]|uniref:Uncharacterized protein n=1 Tax=Phytophthora rubi TaxID=129364 RepID=A0A6A3MT31_9STRA|nr:hypothetical protein PR001_g9826 [Phytophthora rubi]